MPQRGEQRPRDRGEISVQGIINKTSKLGDCCGLFEESSHFYREKWFLSVFQLVFSHIFQIEFIEMSEPAVPAPHGKVPATDGQIVRAGDMAVPACRGFNKVPPIITADLDVLALFADILYARNVNPGSPAVVADHPGLVWHSLDDLVSILSAEITIRPVPCEDEWIPHR